MFSNRMLAAYFFEARYFDAEGGDAALDPRYIIRGLDDLNPLVYGLDDPAPRVRGLDAPVEYLEGRV